MMWFLSGLSEKFGVPAIEFLKSARKLSGFTKSEINQFIRLDVTKDNYLRLIEISDYLLVEDIDPLVDKIVQLYNYHLSIIYTFSEAYKFNSGRIKFKHTRETLEEAIQLYCEDPNECYKKYGFSSYWNVPNVDNMECMFAGSDWPNVENPGTPIKDDWVDVKNPGTPIKGPNKPFGLYNF